jgi:hypothetical protein
MNQAGKLELRRTRYELKTGIVPDPTPERRRTAELAEIENFIAKRGTTRCPDRFAGTVCGAFSPTQEVQRIAALQIEPTLTREERIERLKRSMRSLFR